MNSKTKSIFRLLFTGALWLPVANYLVLLYSFYLRACFSLGHCPTYGQPDPKDLGFTLHHHLAFFSLFFVQVSLVALPIYGLYYAIFRRGIAGVKPGYFGLGCALFVVLLLTMRSEVTNWFLD
jgi:hypothetical protein